MPAFPYKEDRMQRRLTDEHTLKQLLKKEHINPSDALGQNFLVCDEPVDAIVSVLDDQTEHVTELGPGVGALTQALLSNNYAVRAIEKDKQLARLLPGGVSPQLRQKLTLVTGDLRSESWDETDDWQLVGNIPYNLSGYIVRRITELENVPTQAVLMVQREVGENITAQSPNMTLQSLMIQLWGEAHYLLSIPADCYWPKPKVQSALVLLTPSETLKPLDEREQVVATAKRFFSHRRKQLGSIMKNQLKLPTERIAELLTAVGAEQTQRPQELTRQQWEQLSAAL